MASGSQPATATGDRGEVTPERAQRSLQVFARDLARTAAELLEAELDVPSSIDRRIELAVRRIPLRPEVPIALVGGTGSGKSTLINALLSTYVLPISSTFACTSAVTEIAWSGRGHYTADIELVTRDEWQAELDLLERDLADARQLGTEQGGAAKPAEDKLRAVYGEAATARYLDSFDRADLVEPDPIRAAFDRGRHLVESNEVSGFRQQLATYLTSAHQLWPIVRRARIEGPFDLLREGAVLVDLPGLNDPNLAREATTRAYLRSARFVWVLFKMDRALTRDVVELLGDGGLLRRLYMDGRTASLRLVGTGSDMINPLSDITAFGLRDDASDLDIVRARAGAVQAHVRNQLRELALSIGRTARPEPEQLAQLRQDLDQVPVHCVSAVDYQKCIGLDRPVRQVLTSVDDTGIPQLQAALRRQLETHGQRAHLEQINDELWAVRDELEQLLGSALARLGPPPSDGGTGSGVVGPGDVPAAGGPAARMLDTRIRRAVERFEQAMTRAGEVLHRRLDEAGAEAEADVAEHDALWRTMHLSTIRAVLRRGGTWADRDRAIDLNRQIAKPLLDRIPFAWAEFFGHRALVALESLTGDLEQAMGDFLDELTVALAERSAPGALPRGNAASIQAARNLVEGQLRTMQRTMTDRLEADRRRIDEEIREAVRRRMEPTYQAMLAVTGSGAKEKMIDLLATGAAEASRAMHHHLTKLVADLLTALATDLRRDAADVATRIRSEGDAIAGSATPAAPPVDGAGHGARSGPALSASGVEAAQADRLSQLLERLPELRMGADLDSLDPAPAAESARKRPPPPLRPQKPAPPVRPAPVPAWLEAILASDLIRARAGRRRISESEIRRILLALDRHGAGGVPFAVLAAEAGVAERRMAGYLAQLSQIVNIDGYEVIIVSAQSARFDRALLERQLQIGR